MSLARRISVGNVFFPLPLDLDLGESSVARRRSRHISRFYVYIA